MGPRSATRHRLQSQLLQVEPLFSGPPATRTGARAPRSAVAGHSSLRAHSQWFLSRDIEKRHEDRQALRPPVQSSIVVPPQCASLAATGPGREAGTNHVRAVRGRGRGDCAGWAVARDLRQVSEHGLAARHRGASSLVRGLRAQAATEEQNIVEASAKTVGPLLTHCLIGRLERHYLRPR